MELVLIAEALVAWTDTLLLRGELSGLEPKRLRYRALHTAGRLAFHARRATLRLERALALGRGARRRLRAASRAAGAGQLTDGGGSAEPPST